MVELVELVLNFVLIASPAAALVFVAWKFRSVLHVVFFLLGFLVVLWASENISISSDNRSLITLSRSLYLATIIGSFFSGLILIGMLVAKLVAVFKKCR